MQEMPESDENNQQGSLWSGLWRWASFIIGIGGLAALIHFSNPGAVRDTLAQANLPLLVPGIVLTFASAGFGAWRWMLFFHQRGVLVPLERLWGTSLIGRFLDQFLPISPIADMSLFLVDTMRHGGRTVDFIAVATLDRVVNLLTLLSAASAMLLLEPSGMFPRGLTYGIVGFFLFVAVSTVALKQGWGVAGISRILSKLRLETLSEHMDALNIALQSDLGQWGVLGGGLLLSAIINVCLVSASYVAALSITGSLPVLGFLFIAVLIITVQGIPITPGSLGVREGLYVFFLGFLGVSRPEALSIGLLVGGFNLLQGLVGGGVLLLRSLLGRMGLEATGETNREEGKVKNMDEMVRLYPLPAQEIPLKGAYLGHDVRQHAMGEGLRFVYGNFVASVDGRIAIPGGDGQAMEVPKATANPRDWRLFQELAAQADIVISSGRYLRDRAEGNAQEILQVDDPRFSDLRAWREERGLPSQPDIAIISRSLQFPIPDALANGGRKVVVFTTANPDRERVKRIESRLGQVIVAGEESVGGATLVEELVALGYRVIYSAAGPQVLHLLLADRVLDRLYLTHVNRLLAGESYATIVEGPLLKPAVGLKIHSVFLDSAGAEGLGQLFLSYDCV
jgi:riboflavin biosynthesis pyrimidine reductase/uncharacterized membrane protein YbhN (UPF0104 family)